MEVVALVEALLMKVFAATSLPGWMQTALLDLVKRYVTPEVIAALEKELRCYACAEVKALAAVSPSTVDDALADLVCKALGGDDGCK